MSLCWSGRTYCRLCCGSFIKACGYTFSRGNSVKIDFSLFWKGVYSKRKESAPLGSRFFPFRVDPFLEGVWYIGMQTRSHKSCLPLQNMVENLPNVSSPHNLLSNKLIHRFSSKGPSKLLQMTFSIFFFFIFQRKQSLVLFHVNPLSSIMPNPIFWTFSTWNKSFMEVYSTDFLLSYLRQWVILLG